MWKRTLMEESQLLKYAGITNDLVTIIGHYLRGDSLTNQELSTIDKCIEFLDRARDGHALVFGEHTNLAPNAESVEIFEYVTNALDYESMDEGAASEFGERLQKNRTVLELLKKREHQIDPNNLRETQNDFRLVRSELVAESVHSQTGTDDSSLARDLCVPMVNTPNAGTNSCCL